MLFQFILGIIRHCLTYGGGLLTAQGWGTANDWDQVIGAVLTLIGIGWSILDKRKRGITAPSGQPAAPIAPTDHPAK